MLLDRVPVVDGSVSAQVLQSPDVLGLCLGEGRVGDGEKTYPFGTGFQTHRRRATRRFRSWPARWDWNR